MNTRVIRTIAIKDLKEVRQNKGAWIPAVIVPLIFLVLFPALLIIVPTQVEAASKAMFSSPQGFAQVEQYVSRFMGGQLKGLTDPQAWIVLVTGYMFAPFIMIMPLMLSTIIGAESFVGERERKTLEALVYTPASDAELFVGKVVASVAPAVLLAWLSFVLYAVVVNAAAWPVMGRIWFPLASWWPLMFWMAPAVSVLGMGVTVLISVKARTFMEAYQMSGSLVIIVLGLVAGQVSGILFLSVGMVMLLGLVLWIVDAVLIRIGIGTFARASLLSRL